MSVRIYVEGGGRHKDSLSRCRKGFSKLFDKIVEDKRRLKIIACGGRNETFRDFCTAIKQHPSDTVLLLVDSEDEIVGTDCWKHVKDRDRWRQPRGVTNEHIYLMVRCMESWLLTDKDALQSYYGDGFAENALPPTRNIEAVTKQDVESSLIKASQNTLAGRYHKTRHGFDILAALSPSKLATRSVHAKRLVDFLSTI